MINGIEIFSGAGGLATGLGSAGINHKMLVEWNGNACKTLRKNYGSQIVYEGDIRSFQFINFSNIDFIAGGPPCQPFSLGGKAQGNQDSRDMFPQAVRSIRELSPKAFMFENVKGLLRSSFREYLEYILLQLTYPYVTFENGDWQKHYAMLHEVKPSKIPSCQRYKVSLTLINAADYGIPQKRERIIIVGIREDLETDWKFPSPTHSSDALLWDKYVTGKYWDSHDILPSDEEFHFGKTAKESLLHKYGIFPPILRPWKTVRDALKDIPKENDKAYFRNEHVVRLGAKEYPGHTGSLIDEPSKTLKAGVHGVPGGENMVKYSSGEVRYYTVFEAKRIQTFPDDYEIVGSWTEAMRQIGNAVPVELARIIGGSIVEKVFGIPNKQPNK